VVVVVERVALKNSAKRMGDPAYAAVLPPMAALPADEATALATAVRRLAAAT
jgi:hypothetical protein